MTQPFIGEIRMFGGNFAPAGWALCDGSLLPIDQNQALYSLLGTAYGGDGLSNFALPDLRGRLPVHQGQAGGLTLSIGQPGGTESVTLTQSQLPVHSHTISGSSTANSTGPAASAPADWGATQYSTVAPGDQLAPAAVTTVGGTQAHENRSPFLAVGFIIALFGIFPSRG